MLRPVVDAGHKYGRNSNHRQITHLQISLESPLRIQMRYPWVSPVLPPSPVVDYPDSRIEDYLRFGASPNLHHLLGDIDLSDGTMAVP